jgi:hypothetical protein
VQLLACDLAGEEFRCPVAAREDAWRVEDGILICRGQPVGYLRTTGDFTNPVLKLEWRFDPVTKKAGNSGVLLRMIGGDQVWPRSVEAQLHSGNAGDFWNIGEFPLQTDPARTRAAMPARPTLRSDRWANGTSTRSSWTEAPSC